MKRKISFLILSVLTIFMTAVYSNDDKNQFAHIEFDKVVHDFGKIPLKSDASCTYTFTNTGNIPLVLSNVKASCGCTVPEWTKDPVLPGGKGTIKVKYATVQRPHVINKSVVVMSNADNERIILRITGEVVEESQK
jgi:hypothetical protein